MAKSQKRTNCSKQTIEEELTSSETETETFYPAVCWHLTVTKLPAFSHEALDQDWWLSKKRTKKLLSAHDTWLLSSGDWQREPIHTDIQGCTILVLEQNNATAAEKFSLDIFIERCTLFKMWDILFVVSELIHFQAHWSSVIQNPFFKKNPAWLKIKSNK